ncbi:MAG: DUF1444 family protein [Dysgonomonas sp.]|nr:DUF1444 family protein [Dysgonomonas sp.]
MIDFSKVFPRIKATYPNEDITISLGQDGSELTLSYEDSPVMKTLVNNLVISYAIDHDTHYQFILNRDLSEDVTIDKLHEAAISNMINEIGDQIQAHGDPADVLMITNGGNYEATMLIWEDIWPQIESIVGDKIYIAVPARDVLYVAPQNNPASIDRLKELIDKLFNLDDAQGLLVKDIYELTDNGWKAIGIA